MNVDDELIQVVVPSGVPIGTKLQRVIYVGYLF